MKKINLRNILPIAVLSLFVWPCITQGSEGAQGQLTIEGDYIEQLVLQNQRGQTQTFNNPDKTIILQVGRYNIQQIVLKGGFYCYNRYDQISITEDTQTNLKIGSPLKQTIEVKRQGRSLELSYKLTGIGKEQYVSRDRSENPTFIIYKGNKKIASGRFEYG